MLPSFANKTNLYIEQTDTNFFVFLNGIRSRWLFLILGSFCISHALFLEIQNEEGDYAVTYKDENLGSKKKKNSLDATLDI